MTRSYYSYRPQDGHGLAHDPFKAIIAPRPIGWISSQNAQGIVNLAPYSFFNAMNMAPPILAFASIGYKDSLSNIKETGEFCWNFVNPELAQAMNETSQSVAPEVDEFSLAKVKKRASSEVAVPHVAKSPAIMECKLTQLIQLQDIAGELVDTWVIFGQVVAVHIDEQYLHDGLFKTANAQSVMRAGGPGDYFTVNNSQSFFMDRPKD
jgi:flavin reductase (DIM6/NTAB) family NADH-FMN oxidoreductase RutF